MFQEACRFYDPLLCSIGVGNSHSLGCTRGMGCLVGRRTVFTVAHNIQRENGDWPVVVTSEGIFRAEPMAIVAARDFAVLRITEQVRAVELSAHPIAFPKLATAVTSIGTSLGYLTRLPDAGINSGMPHFSPAFASQLLLSETDEVRRVLLSLGTTVQPGMSGSPVFDAESTLQGLLVERGGDLPIMIPIGQFDFTNSKF